VEQFVDDASRQRFDGGALFRRQAFEASGRAPYLGDADVLRVAA
jgi:hypothetical protein